MTPEQQSWQDKQRLRDWRGPEYIDNDVYVSETRLRRLLAVALSVLAVVVGLAVVLAVVI